MYTNNPTYESLLHPQEKQGKSLHFKHCGAKVSFGRLRDLTRVLRHSGSSGHARLALLADSGQQLLDLGNGPAGVQTLGAGLGAIHDGVAPLKNEGCLKISNKYNFNPNS